MKRFSHKLLRWLPLNNPLIKALVYRIRWEKNRLFYRIRSLFSPYKILDPDKIFWIDPQLIELHTNFTKNPDSDPIDRVFHMIKDKGRILSGDWDLSSFRLEDTEVYKAFKQRIKTKTPWQETEFYRNGLARIESGKMFFRSTTREEWEQRIQFLDSLITDMSQKGYIPGFQLLPDKGLTALFLRPEMSEEISINIGRDGQYLFQNGRHRLVLAQLLGIKKVPVRVHVRHQIWAERNKKDLNRI